MTHWASRIKHKGFSRRTFLWLALGIANALVVGDGLYVEPRDLEVKQVSLPLPQLPAGRELRVAHLSDLHIRSFSDYHEEVARLTNAQKPDIVLLTGDFFDYHRDVAGVLKFLGLLRAPLGAFAIQGNWEHKVRLAGERLRSLFAPWEGTLLIDQRHDLEWQGVPISLLGLDYPSGPANLERLRGKVDPNRLNLLLSHAPAFDHDFLGDRVDLVLSGHTHGGQIRLPFLPPFYLPAHSGRFVAGLYRVGRAETPLYVTRGIGTVQIPVRLFCRPEITLFRLYGGRQ